MNDPDESLPDDLLHELLKPLCEASAPPTAQTANRLAVQHALAKQVHPPWWRRSIAVPVPVAIAATIALIVTLATLLRPLPAQSTALNGSSGSMDVHKSINNSMAASVVDEPIRSTWRITQSYVRSFPALAGAGGFVEPNAKENSNDS